MAFPDFSAMFLYFAGSGGDQIFYCTAFYNLYVCNTWNQ